MLSPWTTLQSSSRTMNSRKLLCSSERVTVIDVNKPRISLVGADCEQSCRRWTIGNFADDSGVFVIKDECCKNQQTLLPGPWTGRTIIEEKCDEFEGHLSCLTREGEVLVQKSCLQTWRGAECVLVPTQNLCHENRSYRSETENVPGLNVFRDAATRRLISAELPRFSPGSAHPPDVVCRAGISLKNQQKVRGKCKPLVSHLCSLIREQLRREILVFLVRPDLRGLWISPV